MKKVLIVLLMLFVVLGGLFAATAKDTVKVSTSVDPDNAYAITTTKYEDTSSDPSGAADQTLTLDSKRGSVGLYASAKTNQDGPITLKIAATGFTKKGAVENTYTEEVVDLKITTDTDSEGKTYTTAVTSETSSVTDTTNAISFTESTGVSGLRAFSSKFTVSGDFSSATAGDYVALVSLIIESNN